MKVYRGAPAENTAAAHLVTVSREEGGVGDVWLLEHRVHHSPTGMSWGYLGSGPADLARSILWDHLGSEPHPACYQAFKDAYAARWPQDGGWTLDEREIDAWLERWSAAEVDGGGTGLATVTGHDAWLNGASLSEATAVDHGETPATR